MDPNLDTDTGYIIKLFLHNITYTIPDKGEKK